MNSTGGVVSRIEEFSCRHIRLPALQQMVVSTLRGVKDLFWHLRQHPSDISGAFSRARQENSFWSGKRLEELGCQSAALRCFAQTQESCEHFFASQLELARIYRQSGELEQAVTSVEKALCVQPEAADALLEFGLILHRVSNFSGAENAFASAQEAAPGAPLPLIFRARSLHALGRFVESRRCLSEALGLVHAETPPGVQVELGRLLRNSGDYLAARRYAERAVAGAGGAEALEFQRLIEGDLAVYEGGARPVLEALPLKEPFESSKVLHVLEASLPYRESGYTYRSQYVLTEQRSMGFVPVVATRPGIGEVDTLVSEELHGIKFLRLPLAGAKNYNFHPLNEYLQDYARSLLSVALSEKPALIHATSNFKNALVARAVAEVIGVPWVYELRGLWEDTQVALGVIVAESDRYRFFRSLENEVLQSAGAVVTLSETLRSELVSRGIEREKIFLVPNGVDAERFPVLTEKDRELQERYDLVGALVVGYISSFSAYEGIDTLIDAFGLLLERVPEAKLLLVGDGDAMEALTGQVAEKGIADHVIFAGRVSHEEVLRYYSLIDIFAVPRRPERVCEIVTPLKPFEAMSTGRAVVVSGVPALREMIIEGETGRVFEAGNTENLFEVLQELCNSKELRVSLGSRAAEWVREHRTWGSVCCGYQQAYEFALGKVEQGGASEAAG